MTGRAHPVVSRAARLVLAAALTLGVCAVGAPSAHAIPGVAAQAGPPPIVGAPPGEGPVAPLDPTRQAQVCAEMVAQRGDFVTPPPGFTMLNVSKAWEFSRGAGQKIAVIDTGVFRHPRLSVIPGGDYVGKSNGTDDCDGHGTQVAGIAAAKPSLNDGFAGMAPDAQIIAIRQTSQSFELSDSRDDSGETPNVPKGYGNVVTLARAVVRAVNLGATVINISETACMGSGEPFNDQQLGAAVRYAYNRNVVVVVAAGNLDNNGPCKTQNSGASGARRPDPWAGLSTLSSPAYFQPYVVAVGSVDPDGRPSAFSLAGPWVTVAAPGTDHVSLNTRANPPLIDGTRDGDPKAGKVVQINGTSFATPYVSGLAALIKARFPTLTARQVIDRITRTAHHPSDGRDDLVGYGLIDPVAALTTATSDTPALAAADPRTGDTRNVYASSPLKAPPPDRIVDHTARNVALGITALSVVLAVFAWPLLRNRGNRRGKLEEGADY